MDTTTASDAEVKAGMRSAWALGDYHRFAKATIWEMGPVLVDACRVGPGQRVLDVAAGTGNTAIRAALQGADVVASDLTPENFDAGRREAAEQGVSLEWVEGDAEALPFPDASFDVVTSSFGAIFAPHHQAVADELVRVCRPGGTIGLLAFAPDGMFADFLAACAPYFPPPPEGSAPPTAWGDESHVRELLGDRVASVQVTAGEYVESAASPRAYVDLFRDTFGPVTAAYQRLAEEDPEREAALDGDLLAFATRRNTGGPDGPATYPYGYRLIVAQRRS
jgi:ubiquinone/menaquinone biosynthesis C-methylase UbiE